METKEEKGERIAKASMEVIELLGDGGFTNGESAVILTRCLASLIVANTDKGKRDETLATGIMLPTESVARLEKAIDAGVLEKPEEGGGE